MHRQGFQDAASYSLASLKIASYLAVVSLDMQKYCALADEEWRISDRDSLSSHGSYNVL